MDGNAVEAESTRLREQIEDHQRELHGRRAQVARQPGHEPIASQRAASNFEATYALPAIANPSIMRALPQEILAVRQRAEFPGMQRELSRPEIIRLQGGEQVSHFPALQPVSANPIIWL